MVTMQIDLLCKRCIYTDHIKTEKACGLWFIVRGSGSYLLLPGHTQVTPLKKTESRWAIANPQELIATIKASILFLQNRITFRSYCNGPVLYLPQFSPYNDVSPCMSAGYYINVQWPYHMVMRSQSSENSDFTHLKGNDFILPSSSVAIHRDGDIPLVY